MSNKNRYDLHLRYIARHLSQSIVDCTDEEIREDARLAGVDLETTAAQSRRQFKDIVKEISQNKLVAAHKAYKVEVKKLQEKSFHLPSSIAQQRALLQLVATQQATTGGLFTAKFRDFDKLSDNDVASLLDELAALGLLPDTDTKG
jgi:hypothetical protein